MTARHLKPGQDFQFPSDFGFTGSTQGRHDPQAHRTQHDGEYGDGLARGGQPKGYQGGGTAAPSAPTTAPTARKAPMVPASLAANAVKGAAALGAARAVKRMRAPSMPAARPAGAPGALMAAQRPAPAPAAAPPRPAAAPPRPVAPQAAPAMPQTAMAHGGFLSEGAVKHPGRMTELAHRHGVSLGAEIAHDKHSSDPSLRAAANLGARFRSGEFKHHHGKG